MAGLEPFIDTLCVCTITALVILLSGAWNCQPPLAFDGPAPLFTRVESADGTTSWQATSVRVVVRDATETQDQMRAGKEVFLVVTAGSHPDTGGTHHRVEGMLAGNAADGFNATFTPLGTDQPPVLAIAGVYLGHKGATLTAKAFDRSVPGLGRWIVPATAWLFAFSTIISWSYYGEQGIVYLLGGGAVMLYRIVYCLLILVTTQLVRTESQLDILSTLGTGVMLWANIPIMLLFGPTAMRAYHDYMRRLDGGEFRAHEAPPISDVVSGEDVS